MCLVNSITLTLNIPNVNYLLSTNATDSFFKINDRVTFWVRSERDGCQAFDTIHIRLGKNIQLYLGEDTTICSGSVFELDATVSSGLSYHWNTNQTKPVIPIHQTGKYVVEVEGGCDVVSDSIQITFDGCDGVKIWIPNAFSPNVDGLNETFKPTIISNSCCQIESYRFRVYDLWGELIFDTDKQEEYWDGKILDAVVKQDVYIWMIEFKDVYKSKQFKG